MRLTKAIKQDILNAVLTDAGYIKKRDLLHAQEQRWIKDVMIESIGGMDAVKILTNIEKAHAETYAKVSDPARRLITRTVVDRSSWVYISCGGYQRQYQLDDGERRFNGHNITVVSTSPLGKRYQKLAAAKEDLQAKRNEIEAQVNAVLGSVTTDIQFLKVWPEGKKYLPAVSPKSNLPAVQTAALNKMIKGGM